MDYKKVRTETEAITRNKEDFYKQTNNIYETVAILSKRANQISVEMKTELDAKLSEFASPTDNLEEIFENREQIEIARFYERLAKPTLIAIDEFFNNKIYFFRIDFEYPGEILSDFLRMQAFSYPLKNHFVEYFIHILIPHTDSAMKHLSARIELLCSGCMMN